MQSCDTPNHQPIKKIKKIYRNTLSPSQTYSRITRRVRHQKKQKAQRYIRFCNDKIPNTLQWKTGLEVKKKGKRGMQQDTQSGYTTNSQQIEAK